MNKVGKYAKGGVVQHFANGGAVSASSTKPGASPAQAKLTTEIAGYTTSIAQNKKKSQILAKTEEKLSAEYNKLLGTVSGIDKLHNKSEKDIAALNQARAKLANVEKGLEAVLSKRSDIEKQNTQLKADKSAAIKLASEAKATRTSGMKGGEATTFKESRMNQTGELVERVRAQSLSSQSRPANNTTVAAPSKTLGDLDNSAKNASNKLQQLGIGLSFALSGIQTLLPPLEETSSAATRVSHNLLSTATALTAAITAIQAFNANITGSNIASFLSGGRIGGKRGSQRVALGARNATRAVGGAIGRAGSGISKLFPVTGKLLQGLGSAVTGASGAVAGLAAAAGPAIAIIGGLSILDSIVDSFRNLGYELNKAIDAGDKQAATSLAVSKANADAIPIIGGIVSGLADLGGFGESLTSFLTLFGGSSLESIKADTAARVNAKKANEDLAQSAKIASDAMKEFEDGNITASEALERVRKSTASQEEQIELLNKANKSAAGDRSEIGSGAIARNILSLGGLLFESAGARNQRIEQEQGARQEDILKRRKEVFEREQPFAMQAARSVFARGGTLQQAEAQAGVVGLRQQAQELRGQALQTSDENTAKLLFEQAKQLEDQANKTSESLVNLKTATEEQRKAFEASNLGLTQANGAANALSTAMTNLMATQDSSNAAISNSSRTLEASLTSAAGSISDVDFTDSLNDVTRVMGEFGASGDQIDKFTKNIVGVRTAQANATKGLENFKNELVSRQQRGMATPSIQDQRQMLLDNLLPPGLSEDVRKAMEDQLAAADIDFDKIASGNFDDVIKVIGDVGQAQVKQIEGLIKAEEQYQKTINELAKRRIASENALIQAQQQAIDIAMEARGYEAQFGGAPVTTAERRQAVAARSNVLGRAAGLSDVGTDVASFRRRREEIRAGFAATQLAPGQQQTPENESQAARLKQAQQEQVKSLRDLIKIQQDEIKTIQEKQRLEKESLDSLLTGDIDKFFEQQAAQGAIAAAATGNAQVMGAFGADATGAAAKELQRLQAAGVTEIYGQQIGGAGGLAETTALAGFRQRGLSGQAAVRASQIQAGTTKEMLDKQAEGRGYAAELAAAGDLGADLSQMELNTANMIIKEATIQAQAIKTNAVASTLNPKDLPQGLPISPTGSPAGSTLAPTNTGPSSLSDLFGGIGQATGLSSILGLGRNIAGDIGEAEGRRQGNATFGGLGGVFGGGGIGAASGREAAQAQFDNIFGGLDEQSTETLNNFSNSVQSLQGMEVAHKLGDMNINFGGVDFLANMQPEIRNTVIDELQKQLENYRPSSAGMRKNNSVLPTS